MVKKELVTGFIPAGERLLAELDRQGFPVEAMFWIHLPEDSWKLIIASKIVAREGSLAAYRRLNELLRSMEWVGLRLDVITVVDPGSPEFRSFLAFARGSSRIFDGPEWVEYEEAIVYRWSGASVSGNLSCDVSLDDLDRFWENERNTISLNRPMLLISLDKRRVTLRFHPLHGPQQDISGIRDAFRFALHRQDARPDCQIDWDS